MNDYRADLLDLLARHRPIDADEAHSKDLIWDLVEGGQDPWSRESFVPGHLTASAVVVDSTRSRALLIFHQKLQLWLQPGGHFEAGEREAVAAAAREVLEETGLRTRWPGERCPLLDVDVHLIPARKSEPAHHHFDLRFLLVAAEGTAHAGDGAEAIRWIHRDEVDELGLDPGLRRALGKAFGAEGGAFAASGRSSRTSGRSAAV